MRRVAIPGVFLLVTLYGGPAMSQETIAKDQVEEVEEVDEAEVTPTAQPSETKHDLLHIIGRFHPMLVHFPIAWLFLLVIVDCVTHLLGRAAWKQAGTLLLIGTLIACIPAIVTGLIRATELSASPSAAMVVQHRNLALGAAGVCLAALVVRFIRRNDLGGLFRVAYLSLLFAALITIGLAGHLGGKLAFGEGYLPF